VPEGISVEKERIEGLNAEWVYPTDSDSETVILYLHGGGYVSGSANSHRVLCGTLAQSTQARVLLLEYRLAPENPFPAALVDVLSIYRWLLNQNYDAKNIVLAGDSAGGGLSLATTLSLRGANQPLPAGIVCLSPWTDLTMSGESHGTKAKAESVLTPSNLDLWVRNYTKQENLKDSLISPIFANYDDFPPLLIQVGSEEILLTDAVEVTEKAKAASVDVNLTVWDGMWHVWHIASDLLLESRAAFDEIGRFIRKVEEK